MCGYYQPYWTDANNELEHFGILGMKWGIRRYQNKDGTLTAAGKKRYNTNANTMKEHIKGLKESGAIGQMDHEVYIKEPIKNKAIKLREKEYKIRDRATKTKLEAVEKAISKHPETKLFKAEKNQLIKYIDEEAKSINSLSDQELSKRSRGRKIGYTTAALMEIASAGSFAAAMAAPLTGAGVAASCALGVTWIASFAGGAITAAITGTKYSGDTSNYAKNIKEGNQWLGGTTLKYGGNQIAKAESKARESGKGSFRVSHYTSTGPSSGYYSSLTVPIALIDKYIEN